MSVLAALVATAYAAAVLVLVAEALEGTRVGRWFERTWDAIVQPFRWAAERLPWNRP